MDVETLTNHITHLGKSDFNIACNIILKDILNFHPINVDGKGDGGTDFASFSDDGSRLPVAYQVTTQKTDIKNKAWKDAKKSLEKLQVKRYFFFTTQIISEIDLRKTEQSINNDLGLSASFYDAKTIAGFLISEKCVYKFLNETDMLLTANNVKSFVDYKEMALHSYTLLSEDSKKFKEHIYDDTILFILSHRDQISIEEISKECLNILVIDEDVNSIITRRIDSLRVKGKIRVLKDKSICITQDAKEEFYTRRLLYERELQNLLSAQADLLSEYKISWTEKDSKKISGWLVQSFINSQLELLRETKATFVTHPIFANMDTNSIEKIKQYLVSDKKLEKKDVETVVFKLVQMASTHPLISKLTRSAVYLGLKGQSPISAAKALGANRWSEFSVLIEPTVAIPYICEKLFSGAINKRAEFAIRAIERAIKLDSKLYIPFFYINECAGHLLEARKYYGITLDEKELQYSSNAFVANYYYKKIAGIKVPDDFLEYLAIFSSAIKTEQSNIRDWVRSIMTDIQSILNKSEIEFVTLPQYEHEDYKEIEIEYSYIMTDLNVNKPTRLVNNDISAIKYTSEESANGHKWLIITYDRTMFAIGKKDFYKGWITSPHKYLDLTHVNKSLTNDQFVSLLHTVASFSEQTLSIGARIMDKIILYASKEMQDWEFKQEVDRFKKEALDSIEQFDDENIALIDKKTDKFLEHHGIKTFAKNEEIIYENGLPPAST